MSLKTRCNWADLSSIPSCGTGVGEKSILATPSVGECGEAKNVYVEISAQIGLVAKKE